MKQNTESRLVAICRSPAGECLSKIIARTTLKTTEEAVGYLSILVEEGLLEILETRNAKTGQALTRYKATAMAAKKYPDAANWQSPYCVSQGFRPIRPGSKPTFGFRWMKIGDKFTVPLSDYPGLSLSQLQAKIGSAAAKSAKRFNHKYQTRADRAVGAIITSRLE